MLPRRRGTTNVALTVKSAEFWRSKLETGQSDPHKLWKLVDDLFGRGRVPASSAIDYVVSRLRPWQVSKIPSVDDLVRLLRDDKQ